MARFGFFLVGAAMLSVSCVTLPRGFEGPEGKVVVPSGFLYVDDSALGEWLDTPFKLRYHEMALRDVFATHPLNSMRYRFEGLRRDVPPFTESSVGMTRRQLLYSLAQFYGLSMNIEYEARVPYAIVVKHKPEQATEGFSPTQ